MLTFKGKQEKVQTSHLESEDATEAQQTSSDGGRSLNGCFVTFNDVTLQTQEEETNSSELIQIMKLQIDLKTFFGTSPVPGLESTWELPL